MNILIVDDDPGFAREAISPFEKSGWEADGATNADAFRSLDSSLPEWLSLKSTPRPISWLGDWIGKRERTTNVAVIKNCGPTSFVRAIFEFAVPVVIGTYAVVALALAPPPDNGSEAPRSALANSSMLLPAAGPSTHTARPTR